MKGLLIDLDGVLWFSEKHHKDSFVFALKPYIEHADKLISETWNFGESTEEYLIRLFTHIDMKVEDTFISELARRKRLKASQLDGIPINQELVDCLSILRTVDLKIGLVSSSSAANVQRFLTITQTRNLFDCVVDRSFVRRPKPSPDCYNFAMQQLKLSPPKCLVLEDSASGINAARNAGVSKVLVYPTDFEFGKHLEILEDAISQLG